MEHKIQKRDGSSFRRHFHRPTSRARGSIGATMVEYVLVLALVVVPSIGGITYLSAQGKKSTNNQADCISKRPPPPSCQVPQITTTTTVTPSSTSSTTVDPSSTSSTSSTSTTAAPTSELAWDTAASKYTSSPRQITVVLNLVTNPGSAPVAGANVAYRITVYTGSSPNYVAGPSFGATCTSDASGACTTVWAVPTGFTRVTVQVLSVDSNPSAGTLPGTLTFSTP